LKESKLFLIATVISLFFITRITGFSTTIIRKPEEVPAVGLAFERFLTIERQFIQRGLSNAAGYLPFIRDVFITEGLPEDLVWLPLIESAFSTNAYSRAGACGLWQFMPGTAGYYNLKIDFWVDERRDPFKSTERAAKLLKNLYSYYDDWELALAAYNAGIGCVDRAIEKGNSRDFWELSSERLLKRETREYIPRFFAAAYIAENYERYGFFMDSDNRFPEYEILHVKKPIDLTIFATKSGIKLGMLKELNPELQRYVTPFGKNYNLRVPKEKLAPALAVYQDLPKEDLAGVRWHTVRTGETLSEISEKYNTKVTLVKRINNIRNSKKVYAGSKILVPVNSENIDSEEDSIYLPKKGFKTQEIVYEVRNGDTLWGIARRYETEVDLILAVNGLTFESVIMPGDTIKLWIDTAFQR
jgi:membrane-bound lytic murein transglycosylase D